MVGWLVGLIDIDIRKSMRPYECVELNQFDTKRNCDRCDYLSCLWFMNTVCDHATSVLKK